MAKKKRARRGATTYVLDEDLIKYLEEHSPETLETKVSESAFDASVDAILKQPLTDEIRHFYCRPCAEYHPKTHPHYREMRKRQVQARTDALKS
jgi:hypothetical protein